MWYGKLGYNRLVVISGGQFGADSAGLAAAYDLGLPTGGWAPKGWITKYGPNPMLEKLGLLENISDKYPPRTYANVKSSDGTIRLAYDFNTPGERCTFKAIGYYQKPYLDIDLNEELPFIFDVVDWVKNNNIKVLNIAGNAGNNKEESSKIFTICRNYLKCVFRDFIGDNPDGNQIKGHTSISRCSSTRNVSSNSNHSEVQEKK